MKKTTFRVLSLQLLIFLSYQLLIFFFTRRFEGYNFVVFESVALSLHAFILLLLTLIYFRARQVEKAVGTLIPFFIVLLIGLGSCSNGYNHNQESYEVRNRQKQDSMHIADSVAKAAEQK